MHKEADYKALFESLPGSYLILRADFTICAVSNDYLTATLTKRSSIINRHIFDVFPENGANNAANAISNLQSSLNYVLKNKEAHTMAIQRYDIRRPDGRFEERYWSPVNKPLLDNTGKVLCIIHRVEDVTDFVISRKEKNIDSKKNSYPLSKTDKIEIELLNRSKEIASLNRQLEQIVEERTAVLTLTLKDVVDYKTALDISNIVAVTDEKGVITYANDNFCRISKFSRAELEGKTHHIINSGYHSKEFFRDMWNTISSGNTWRREIKNKAKDGSFYWVDTTIIPFKDWQGVIHKYLAIRTDITERKKFLEELTVSEENFRSLFENALVGMATTDMQLYKTIDVNEYCATLFGYSSRKEFLARYDPKVHYEKSKEREENLLLSQKNGQLIKREQKMRRLNGDILWVDLYIKLSSDGAHAHTIVIDVTKQKISRDILEKKVSKRTQKLSQLLKKEKELNQLKSRFVSFASHEFRTPLTVISSIASFVKMYSLKNNDTERAKLADTVLSSIRDLTSILDNFLSLSKLENGKIEVIPQTIILPEFIESIIEEMTEVTNKKKQNIHYRHNGETRMIQSKIILKNILLNLLSNASKYSQENKSIEISSSISDGLVRISVKDYGIGIPQKDHKQLFSEFFRADNVGNISGTGLGLNIVKKYIELLHGNIQFTSNCTEGTLFQIEIPQQIIKAEIPD